MESYSLIEQLEQQFGNPYAPKRYLVIQEAIEVLKLQAEEIKALHAQIQEQGK